MDKLEERLVARAMLWDATVQANTPQHLINPDGPEALAEITRLKGEVEQWKSRHRDGTDLLWERAEKAEAALTAQQALRDELVDGLSFYRDEWRKAEHPFGMAGPAMTPTHRLLCDYGERARSLIPKARSSGKAGSDAGVER